ncbi:MAG: helix-turn-helix transcriptional regulator, partial [Clostridiaceae bacterium]|nr:helix-turn-helix transcriptional regulator [Clostridiaceae bacterium]
LLNNELCVCEIFATLDMSQPRVSRQLAILKQSKIIKDRREGKWIYYRIDENENTKHLMSILTFVPDWLCDDAEFNNDRSSFKKISVIKSKLSSCEGLLTGGEKLGE